MKWSQDLFWFVLIAFELFWFVLIRFAAFCFVFDWFWLVLIHFDSLYLVWTMNSVSLYAESLKCYKWSHFTVLPVQCRARLSMAVTAASNARSRAWGAKKKGWKVQILLAIIDLLIYILKVLCSYLQHLLLFRSPVVLLFKKQEFRSQQPICHCTIRNIPIV